MNNKKLFMVVMIPFILLCLLIARAEYHLSVGAQWDFAITGYDPRDLLRGHYLRFRLAYDWQETKNECSGRTSCSYCLTDIGEQAPKVQIVDTHTAKQCDGFMQYDDLQTPLNRFYIAETQAKLAEDILRQARIDNTAYLRLSINKKGEPRIVDLLIDGRPLEELLKEASKEE
ncbi:MAG: GDYXXLXY domain-containing protein [Methylophaga sp.]|nr:GDYXXLXY domain-containing protein [Methylophaga sp.]